ncbi:MAG: hypothetical protein CM15mP95_2760 [Alphaproteobacteria bacterium]|nr:MAG: hypothetical protein CM15mP95_2760 [Alphaproteobacteria bacterium]
MGFNSPFNTPIFNLCEISGAGNVYRRNWARVALVILFFSFIGLVSFFTKKMIPVESNLEPINWLKCTNDLLPFVFLITFVLGSIYLGIATPTEAAAVGCLGSSAWVKFGGSLLI